MKKRCQTFEEFKKTIDNYDNFYLNFFNDCKKSMLSRENEKNKADADNVIFYRNIISNNISSYNELKKEIDSVIDKIKDEGIKNLDYDKNNILFSNISDAISYCEKNIAEFKNAISSINSYSFTNNGMEFNFDGESAIIDGVEYKSPNFPDLDESFFDRDVNYKEKIRKIFEIHYTLSLCIDFIIKYYSSDSYEKHLKNKANNAEQIYTHFLDQKMELEIENFSNAFLKLYKEDYIPFIEDNNHLLTDYLTLDNFDMPVNFKNDLNIGSLHYKLNNFSQYTEVVSQYDSNKYIKKDVYFPYIVDLTKKGNILINTDKISKELVDFVHQLVMQFISTAPYKKMNLALIDVDEFDEFDLINSFSKEYLKKNKLIFGNKIVTEGEDFNYLVKSLCDKINEIKGEKLSPKNCKNVFEYNDISRENTQEMYLLLYVNCPKCLNSDIAKRISNLSINGNMCGIYSIIVNNINVKLPKDSYQYNADEHNEFIEKISSNSIVINCHEKGKKFTINDDEFYPNFAFKEENVNEFFNIVNKNCDQAGSTQIIYLDSIIQEKYEKKPYYNQIKIPVGKDGGQVVYFELDVEGANTSSAIIAGGTGSGKSSFLHSIILSGAYNYSPDELEFYLIDFKDGVEFSPYKDKEYGINIPHISFLSLKNKVEDAYDILTRISAEKEYRNECFKKVNAANLISYQNHPDVKSGKYPSFKRTIVMIDEYQNFLQSNDTSSQILCNKCAGILLELLSQIRNVGISLVLASQSIFVERAALDQINNRYVFSSSATVIQTAFPEHSGDAMNVDLNKEKGLVYKSSNGGISKQLFKAAWSGKTNEKEQKNISNMINEKWKGFSKDLLVSGNEDALPIYKSKAPFVISEEVELTEDGLIKNVFGQSALSDSLASVELYDSDFCNYLIIGEMKKVRNIEASIGLSFLYYLKKYNFDLNEKNLYYIDLNNTNDAKRNISPFEVYKEDFKNLMYYSFDTMEIVNSINDLYNEYEKRKDESKNRNRTILVPKLMIINSFSLLKELEDEYNAISSNENNESYEESSNLSNDTASILAGLENDGMGETFNNNFGFDNNVSLIEKVKEIYSKGYNYSIYIIIQDRRIDNIKSQDSFDSSFDFSKVICCDKNELENCVPSITITELPQRYVVLYPSVSKIRPFEFDKSNEEKLFIKKFVEGLTND